MTMPADFTQNPFFMMQLARNNPALLTQLQANQRQQMLAQSLMQQGQTPLPTDQTAGNSAGAFVVPISPLAAFTKAASTALGGYEMGQTAKNQNQLLAQMLGGQPQNPVDPAVQTGASPTDDTGSPIQWNGQSGGAPGINQTSGAAATGGQMDAGLIHKMAAALGVSDSDVSEGMMYSPEQTLKAGMAALQNTPALAGARKGAEQAATIFPNTTYGGRENVPMTGAQITAMNDPANSAPTQPSPQISNTPASAAPLPAAPGPQTAAGQYLPPVGSPLPLDPTSGPIPPMNAQNFAANGIPNIPITSAPANAPVPIPSSTGSPPGAPIPGAAPVVPPPGSTTSVPQAANVQGFGINPAVKSQETAQATKTGENSADTQKTLNVMQSNLPQVLNRLNEIKQASLRANFGYGVDNEGDGVQQKFAQQFLPDVDVANGILKTRAAQGILPELGPTLAQAGIKGNKFLETLSSNASGVDLAASVPSKINTAVNLENQYIKNYKASAAQARGQGQPAPTDEQIDAMVAAERAKLPPIQIKDNGDYNVLPSGTSFMGPDGHVRVKP